MQVVYIDVLIFTNMFEDYLLLLCLKRILKLNLNYIRLILGCVCGGALSLTALLPEINFVISLVTKVFSAVLLVLITFGYKNKKIFIKEVSTLFILSFLLNGALIFFYLTIQPMGMEIINDTVYFNISPALLIILTLLVYFILFIYRKLFSNTIKSSQIHKVKIYYGDSEVQVDCKYDSGCNVKEPFSGSEVIIIEEVMLKNIKIADNIKRVIPFNSLGGKGIIYGFRPDKVEIDDIIQEKEIYIGICKNLLNTEIKGLIPENLLKG
ncbi:MAG: sigma-E processing peptidase SpoIIGA [Ruminococcus sp.]